MNPTRTLLLLTLFSLVIGSFPAHSEPRYLLFNIAPGHDWKQETPGSQEKFQYLLSDILNTLHPPQRDNLQAGAAFTFSILNSAPNAITESLTNLLAASLVTGVPVMVALDGQNWWEERPELWNWWDPESPGYNPSNVLNVEWAGWSPSEAVKIGWRNWGIQIRVAPAPNLASPRFLEANSTALKQIIPVVVDWYNSLPAEKKFLFAGLKLGWEASIGYNAYYYPDGNRFLERWPDNDVNDPSTGLVASNGLSGGALQLGYAAVRTAGIKTSGEITRDDIGKVTQSYLALLSKTAVEAGLAREQVYTHQGGVCPPWDQHLPFWPALNEWSCPGWSFYWGPPSEAGNLNEEMERAGVSRWGAAEWWWSGTTPEEWVSHFTKTLQFRDCRFVCIYNWNQGGIASRSDALNGTKLFLEGWQEPPATK